MERNLLLQIKKLNGAMDKKPKPHDRDKIVEIRGLKYNRERGGVGGNTGETMILVSAGDEHPGHIVVEHREKMPALAEIATQHFGSLPATIPGLHEEIAADLMATASIETRDSTGVLTQLLLDVPSIQRSKHYYLEKIEKFLQSCQEPAGRKFECRINLYENNIFLFNCSHATLLGQQ